MTLSEIKVKTFLGKLSAAKDGDNYPVPPIDKTMQTITG